MPRTPPLTPKARRFVEEYLVDLDASNAAKRAGYSTRTAKQLGYQLLKRPAVKAALEAAQATRAKKTGITQERVLLELEQLAFSNLSDYVMTDDGHLSLAEGAPEHAMRAVASLKRRTITRPDGLIREVEFRLWDKPGSLKLAGRHVGLFADRVEHSGPGGGPIKLETIQAMSDAELKARALELVAKL